MTRLMGLGVALVFLAHGALAQDVTEARYDAPTDRYAHGILGDAIEWGALVMTLADGRQVTVTLPQSRVFEDTEPRLVDVDLDGMSEVMVVESHQNLGARLAIYDGSGVIKAATPHIGTRNRWLAPIGAADMDGDGRIELAYVDRPHLAKQLLVWRYEDGGLVQIAAQAGLTNHRIGERDIGGGLRICDGTVQMITASADWSQVVATMLKDDQLISQVVGPHRGRVSLRDAMDCDG